MESRRRSVLNIFSSDDEEPSHFSTEPSNQYDLPLQRLIELTECAPNSSSEADSESAGPYSPERLSSDPNKRRIAIALVPVQGDPRPVLLVTGGLDKLDRFRLQVIGRGLDGKPVRGAGRGTTITWSRLMSRDPVFLGYFRGMDESRLRRFFERYTSKLVNGSSRYRARREGQRAPEAQAPIEKDEGPRGPILLPWKTEEQCDARSGHDLLCIKTETDVAQSDSSVTHFKVEG